MKAKVLFHIPHHGRVPTIPDCRRCGPEVATQAGAFPLGIASCRRFRVPAG